MKLLSHLKIRTKLTSMVCLAALTVTAIIAVSTVLSKSRMMDDRVQQMKAAVDFCRRSQRAALVIVLEQCTWASSPIHEKDNGDFKSSLRTHLLFSDGAAAILIVPETLAGNFSKALRIIDVGTDFRLGQAITMKDGHFLVGDNVKATMPRLVASQCVRPMLSRHGLIAAEVADWALHQGGLPVLMQFKDESILGLTDAQLTDSSDTFADFGNLSAASCFFALRRQFKRSESASSLGMVVAFGAGYYFGCFLYETCNPQRARSGRASTGVRRSDSISHPLQPDLSTRISAEKTAARHRANLLRSRAPWLRRHGAGDENKSRAHSSAGVT
jgi:hypothetical protein